MPTESVLRAEVFGITSIVMDATRATAIMSQTLIAKGSEERWN